MITCDFIGVNMTISFLVVLLLVTLVIFMISVIAAERIGLHHYEQKADFFKHYPIKPEDFVFMGDSITDGACWDELFPGLPVKNRGINADTIKGVFHRLEDVIAGRPTAVFLLIGTNDLPWYMHHKDNEILLTYEAILQSIQSKSPDTEVFVQSILPRQRCYTGRILKLNRKLEELSKSYRYTFINLFPHFVGDDSGIRADFSNDGLHLMAKGYTRWAEILTPYLKDIQDNH
jgi:lysophospholipase L1-like esterase